MTPEQLGWLLTQQGFAGRLEVCGAIARWHRFVDFQPDSTVIDAGRMVFGQDMIEEHGLHSPYREVWRRTAPRDDHMTAMELLTENDQPRRGVLVAAGEWFMYALGRRTALACAPSLAALMAMDREPRTAGSRLLDAEMGFGVCRGEVPWQIQRCTHPWREGDAFFMPQGTELQNGGVLQHDGNAVRRWRVAECTSGFPWFD